MTSAQVMPTSMQTTSLAMPSGLSAKPLAINNKGEVGGWGAKSAGTVLKYIGRPVWPYGTKYSWVSIPVSYIYPVVWTNGSPVTQTRYKGNLNTAIFRAGPSGGWHAMSTGKSTKEPTADWTGNTYDNLPTQADVDLSLVGSTYAPLSGTSNAFWGRYYPPMVNQRGTVAGEGGVAGSYVEVQILVDGKVVTPPKPVGVYAWSVVGISDDDHVLIRASRDSIFTQTDAGVVYTQYQWQQRCFVWHKDVLTEVTAPSPATVVSVDCGGISPNGLVAAYVAHNNGGKVDGSNLQRAMFTWRDGQVVSFQSPFQLDKGGAAPRVALQDNGVGYYTPAAENLAGAAPDLWVFAQGQHQRVNPLVRPAIASNTLVVAKGVNASGQVLAEFQSSLGSSYKVLTPR